jgi:hypothetical protein
MPLHYLVSVFNEFFRDAEGAFGNACATCLGDFRLMLSGAFLSGDFLLAFVKALGAILIENDRTKKVQVAFPRARSQVQTALFP